jgi:antitoxin component YwqK of YwqJK toxin-antitoxin module
MIPHKYHYVKATDAHPFSRQWAASWLYTAFFCKIITTVEDEMKTLIYISFLLMPAFCNADTFLLKDGAKLEGEVTGEMDGTLLVKTKYGPLTINKADIMEQKPALATALPEAAAPAVATSTASPAPAPLPAAPAVEISTAAAPVIDSTASAVTPPAAPAIEVSTPALEISTVGFTFVTVLPNPATRLFLYFENGVCIATETFDAGGALLSADGLIKDGTYTESYPGGALKTVKTISGGKTSGTLKAYYQSGSVQIEAYYLGGAKDGIFKYFAEDGKPLMEAAYINDKLNGWKKEYGPDGAVKNETYYENDRPTELPKMKDTPVETQEQDTMMTAKVTTLARGARYSFELNGKYLGKAVLDKQYNVTSQEGSVPDGSVRIYSAEGKLQKEFVFQKNEIKILRVFEDGGPLKATYTFKDGKATQFALH